MNSFTNYLEKLGSNFLVSAMIPALAFLVASILMFDPILPVADAFKNPQGTPQLIGFGLMVFILTVILGFTLTALNTHILKIFEGYITFPPVRFLYNKAQRVYREKARILMNHREDLKKEYRQLNNITNQDQAIKERLEKILDEYHKVAFEYDQSYPDHLDDVLPTRFGNVLRAAEGHAVQRYGFDGVTFWPRLMHVIPDSYKTIIDSTRNELSFFVNLSILSIFFSFLCTLAIFPTMLKTTVVTGDVTVFWAFVKSVLSYILGALLGLLAGRFFYRASIISLGSFTLTIRASIDLFRLDLLKKLEIVRPSNFDEEFDTWSNLNELVVLGNRSITFQAFAYREEEKNK